MTDSIAASVLAELASFDKMRRDNADLREEVAELRAGLAVPEPIAVLRAERDALANVLRRIVEDHNSKEFAWTARQRLWREAKALLVEGGHVVGDEPKWWVDR